MSIRIMTETLFDAPITEEQTKELPVLEVVKTPEHTRMPLPSNEDIDAISHHYGLGELLAERSWAVVSMTKEEIGEILIAPTLREKIIRWLFNLLVRHNDKFSLVLVPKDIQQQIKYVDKNIEDMEYMWYEEQAWLSPEVIANIKQELKTEIMQELMKTLKEKTPATKEVTREPIEKGRYEWLTPPIILHSKDKRDLVVIDAHNYTKRFGQYDWVESIHDQKIWYVIIP